MSTIDQAISDASSADEVLAAAAPVLAALVPAAAGPAGVAISVGSEALAVIQALVAWVEKQNLAAAANVVAVTAVETAVDVAEKAKFGA